MRTAQCACGQLTVRVDAEPAAVVACSCLECQRKSGSAFGLGAYFAKGEVSVSGDSRTYSRTASSGHLMHNHFCPVCGATVYWTMDRDPERIGVSVGAFADPDFLAPTRSVFDLSKHAWVKFPDDVPGFSEGRDSARTR
ncbi:MAG: GFA family protein [Hyphomonadaceae bacterium]